MWYTIKWTGLEDNTYTRDYHDVDKLHAFVATLLINGFSFNVQAYKQEQT